MRKNVRKMFSTALLGGVVVGSLMLGASPAAAIPPGHGFVSPRFGMGCVAGADVNGNGYLTCTGHGNYWDTLVYCSGNPWPYVGTLEENHTGGPSTSTSISNCWFGVSDIQIREYA